MRSTDLQEVYLVYRRIQASYATSGQRWAQLERQSAEIEAKWRALCTLFDRLSSVSARSI